MVVLLLLLLLLVAEVRAPLVLRQPVRACPGTRAWCAVGLVHQILHLVQRCHRDCLSEAVLDSSDSPTTHQSQEYRFNAQ
jgi:hypothetical protein